MVTNSAPEELILPTHRIPMSTPTANFFVLVVAMVIVMLLALWQKLQPKTSSAEPPLISPRLPLIGHSLDILIHGPKAWKRFHDTSNKQYPIISLPIPGLGKIYMATSNMLITPIFTCPDLSLNSIVTFLISPLIPFGPKANKDYNSNDVFPKWLRSLSKSLSTHKERKNMTTRGLSDLNKQLELVGNEFESGDMGMWIRNVASRAILVGLLGDLDWAKDQKFIDTVWTFEWDLESIFFFPVPSLTVPRAYKAREHILDVLETWLIKWEKQDTHNNQHEDGQQSGTPSPLITELLAIADSLSWPARDKAKIVFFLVHVSLSNMVQLFFWFFAHVYADKHLVERLRKEVYIALQQQKAQQQQQDEEESHVGFGRYISQEELTYAAITPTSCPLLHASLQETHRLVDSTPVIRYVTRDTTISDGSAEFILKKGNLVLAPRPIISHDPTHWGEGDTNVFDPTRFLGHDKHGAEHGKMGQTVGKDIFFPFGGGRDMCPGRHVATSTVMGVMATLLTTLDFHTDEGGYIKVPDSGPLQLSTVIWRIPKRTTWRGKIRRRHL